MGDHGLVLEVREDRCFHSGTGWLNVGEVKLQPGADLYGKVDGLSPLCDAVRFGFYEWHVRSENELQESILQLFDIPKEERADQHESARNRLRKALISLTHAAQRVGLQHPVFDAGSVEGMPFRRPTTIVCDTNSVLQGSLDFVVRFLSPTARVKIPAVVHMEILLWSDNFFALRRERDPKKIPKGLPMAFGEHLRSQGAQRALLRLELLTDVELERARIGADPLRGIVYPDPDQEAKALGIQAVQRSFADRLILETALQHLQQAPSGHPVALLTSDQGLARMALSEGIRVLFYEAAELHPVTGQTIPGTLFHPFTGNLYSIPLTTLLWELAVSFGSCRLRGLNGTGPTCEIHALGDRCTWMPYHAREDLLWVCAPALAADSGEEVDDEPADAAAIMAPATPITDSSPVGGSTELSAQSPQISSRHAVPSYKFSPKVMLKLIESLSNGRSYTNAELMHILHFTHERKLAEYRSFLLSGSFITYNSGSVTATDDLGKLWTAIHSKNYEHFAALVLQVDSLKRLFKSIRDRNPLQRDHELPIKSDAWSNYKCFLEMSGLLLQIEGEGVYTTPNRPKPSEFVEAAFEAYLRFAVQDSEYIATGAWLEALARTSGIHPLVARDRLEEARAAGLLERYVEGSTPDTRYINRTFCMLDSINNQLTIRDVSLYEGDFLIPGKGSVLLRLKRVA